MEIEYNTLDQEAFCVLLFATMVDDENLRNKVISLNVPTKENAICVISKYVSTQVSSGIVAKGGITKTIEMVAAFREDMVQRHQRGKYTDKKNVF